MFICERASASGGATPVVGTQLWLESIDDEVRAAFADGLRYTQNMHAGVGLGKSWQMTFETDDRAEFIKHIQETGLSLSCESDWQIGDVLLIDNVAVAHGRRPFTGDRRILVAMSG
jgi:hypothetical protein